MQLIFIGLEVASSTEALILCTRRWNRGAEIIIYVIIMTGFCIAYPQLVSTAQLSANFAYLMHRKKLRTMFLMVEFSLFIKVTILLFSLVDAEMIDVLQWAELAKKIPIVVPVLYYCAVMKSDEDCLTCFSRFPNNLFSRF